jgi:hypothetical protein
MAERICNAEKRYYLSGASKRKKRKLCSEREENVLSHVPKISQFFSSTNDDGGTVS